ncbi:MAG: PspC domain-containing protein [Anaerosomatales bacterium]|nr:PspC domain-containing protein [Anaerosomatales bacterium]MDT8433669.1 PspC domain-containing protein [Anaerosomatales bacterium]
MADKTLYRSRDDRMAGGVCAGIADYFDLDPTVVRMLTVLAALLSSGGAIIAYIVLWAVVPEEPGVAGEGAPMSEEVPSARSSDQPPPPPTRPSTAPPAQPAPARVEVAPPLPPVPPKPPASAGRGSIWVGLVLVFVGGVLLVQMFLPQIRLWAFWPLVLIVWGLVVIFRPRGGE